MPLLSKSLSIFAMDSYPSKILVKGQEVNRLSEPCKEATSNIEERTRSLSLRFLIRKIGIISNS